MAKAKKKSKKNREEFLKLSVKDCEAILGVLGAARSVVLDVFRMRGIQQGLVVEIQKKPSRASNAESRSRTSGKTSSVRRAGRR